ncbi:PREDICTED: exopolygalacturonase-like [Nelumbo nucifera]|uniref:Exopolygalacturonase-like n=1 Tax=Nelumbo nucifera TaxID=4432 RepID=A0A1U8Q9Q0_NELNU|nr:PREDICTED: exopolygalacturonase-like [Nelumbo nucifera]
MAPSTDIVVKAGIESFGMLEDCTGRMRPPYQAHHPRLHRLHQHPSLMTTQIQIAPKKEATDSYQAVQACGRYLATSDYCTKIPLFSVSCVSNGAVAVEGPITTSVFNVVHFGAHPNGKKESTQAFMKAWIAACHWGGKARLVIPTGTFLVGQVFFTGPCNSPIPIIVQVKGTVKAVSDVSEYPSAEWISFESLNGLILTGGGTFDGQGAAVWQYNDCEKNPDCQILPMSIKFSSVKNANVRRINSVNSKSFHIAINHCENFRAHDLHITAPEDSPNTDGIHISSSIDVRISKSYIATGDDCISIGQGSTNISIARITCGPGHGISVGSLGKYPDEKDVKGITVKNCTLTNTDNGVRIKTWPGSPPSQASKLRFEDIIMNNVRNPIIIDQLYCPKSEPLIDSVLFSGRQPSRVKISDVHFKNIRGTSASKVAVNIACSEQLPCEDVQLFDIDLKYNSTKPDDLAPLALCSNAQPDFGGTQMPAPCR